MSGVEKRLRTSSNHLCFDNLADTLEQICKYIGKLIKLSALVNTFRGIFYFVSYFTFVIWLNQPFNRCFLLLSNKHMHIFVRA